MTPHQNGLVETALMRGHKLNISCDTSLKNKKKNIFELSSVPPLIWSFDYQLYGFSDGKCCVP